MNRVNITVTMQPASKGVALLEQKGALRIWWATGYDEDSLKISSKVNPSPWSYLLPPNAGTLLTEQQRKNTFSPFPFQIARSFDVFFIFANQRRYTTNECPLFTVPQNDHR
jgi:hypothetical protein